MLELGTATDQLEQQARLLSPTIAAIAVSILIDENQEARNKLSVTSTLAKFDAADDPESFL